MSLSLINFLTNLFLHSPNSALTLTFPVEFRQFTIKRALQESSLSVGKARQCLWSVHRLMNGELRNSLHRGRLWRWGKEPPTYYWRNNWWIHFTGAITASEIKHNANPQTLNPNAAFLHRPLTSHPPDSRTRRPHSPHPNTTNSSATAYLHRTAKNFVNRSFFRH